uniref:(northern house mosquito) hypothetical protein n=1 Tax=Culex pipiens TaxID=7175 RepID=A0A8D8BMH8_CULPI
MAIISSNFDKNGLNHLNFESLFFINKYYQKYPKSIVVCKLTTVKRVGKNCGEFKMTVVSFESFELTVKLAIDGFFLNVDYLSVLRTIKTIMVNLSHGEFKFFVVSFRSFKLTVELFPFVFLLAARLL